MTSLAQQRSRERFKPAAGFTREWERETDWISRWKNSIQANRGEAQQSKILHYLDLTWN